MNDRKLLELLRTLAGDAAGEIPEIELAQRCDLTAAQLETFSRMRYVKTRYRGAIGTGYIAWSITEVGRTAIEELAATLRSAAPRRRGAR